MKTRFFVILCFAILVGTSAAVFNHVAINGGSQSAQLATAAGQYSWGGYGSGVYGGAPQPDPDPAPEPKIRTRTVQKNGADITNRTHRMRLQQANSDLKALRSRRESDLREEAGFRYPLGLYEFEAEVDPGSTETVTIELDRLYDTTQWSFRKYDGTAYTDITGQVTFGESGGVTTITYDVTDNGPLDLDARAGYILDPAGPAIVEDEEDSGSSGSSDGSSGGGSSGGGSSRTNDDDEDDEVDSVEETVVTEDDTDTVESVSDQAPAPVSVPTITNVAARLVEGNVSFIQPEVNNAADVINVERFLNEFEGESLALDGVYSSTDNEAVKRFQRKYSREILDVWNLTEATGYVGITTRLKINFLLKGQSAQCPVFTEFNGGISPIMVSDEIMKTKEILRDLDMYSGPIDRVWTPQTHEAMVVFQETFREVMLDPWNITEGTGYKYKTTNKFLNYFAGCDTGAVYLEGVGTYEGI